jgi:Flp pilus assembly protein CpaB
MEMEFKDPARRRRVTLVVIGGMLAAAAGLGAFTLASKGTPQTVVETKTVLVAARDIAARTTITGDDVKTQEVPVEQALSQSYASPTDVVGRVTSVPIYSAQQVTPNLFATTAANADFSILNAGDTVTADSPPWRAVSVKVPPERAVGGELKDGQHVDIVISVAFEVFAQATDGTYSKVDGATADGLMSGTSTKITFQDIEVLKASPDDDLYVLKVDLHQAEQIAHVVQEAPDSFELVLRPDEDTRAADPNYYGVTTDRLVAQYLFPVPLLQDMSKLLGIPLPSGAPTVGPVPGGSPEPSGSPTASGSPDGSPAPSPEASPTP